MLKTSQLLVFTLHLVYYILLHQQLTFKTDILGQYFTQYWSDLYYTAMFNSSESTHCISLSLCTLLTKLSYTIICLKFSHFLKFTKIVARISANLAQCDLIRFSLFLSYSSNMNVTSTQANYYHIFKSIL